MQDFKIATPSFHANRQAGNEHVNQKAGATGVETKHKQVDDNSKSTQHQGDRVDISETAKRRSGSLSQTGKEENTKPRNADMEENSRAAAKLHELEKIQMEESQLKKQIKDLKQKSAGERRNAQLQTKKQAHEALKKKMTHLERQD